MSKRAVPFGKWEPADETRIRTGFATRGSARLAGRFSQARFMRILFTFAGGVGHFLPLVPVARAMACEGHEVAFGAQFALLPALRQAGFTAFYTSGDFSHDPVARFPLTRVNIEEECQSAVSFVRPIGRERASAIIDLAEEWKPDLFVCDELDYGCMIAAERLSIPYATMLVIATGLMVRPGPDP